MNGLKRSARIAGLWYLAMGLSGPIGLVYAPSKIIVAGDAETTASNLAAHELLLRVGVASSLVCQVSFVFLVLALKQLFQSVNAAQVRLMVMLVVASVPIAVANLVFPLAALELAGGAPYLNALAPAQRSALALLALNVHQLGIYIVEIFWGLWLFPFAALVLRSEFIPKVFGVLLIVSGACYLIECFVMLLAPRYQDALAHLLPLPMAAGEVSMIFWLLIKGVRERAAAGPSVGSLPA
jgi:hypothetical protein